MSIKIAFVDDSQLMHDEFKLAVKQLNKLGYAIKLELLSTRDKALKRIEKHPAKNIDVFFVDYNICEHFEEFQHPRSVKGTAVVEAAKDANIVTVGFSGKQREWEPTVSSIKHPDSMILSIALVLQAFKEGEKLSDEASVAIPDITSKIYKQIGLITAETTYRLRAEGAVLHDDNKEALEIRVKDLGADKKKARDSVEATRHPFLNPEKLLKLGVSQKKIDIFSRNGEIIDLAGLISNIARYYPHIVIPSVENI